VLTQCLDHYHQSYSLVRSATGLYPPSTSNHHAQLSLIQQPDLCSIVLSCKERNFIIYVVISIPPDLPVMRNTDHKQLKMLLLNLIHLTTFINCTKGILLRIEVPWQTGTQLQGKINHGTFYDRFILLNGKIEHATHTMHAPISEVGN
jgi:hypothetical protein